MHKPGFPPGANLKGGQNAAPVHAEDADAFYAPIIPIVLELREQGQLLRAIARELDRREIRTRCEYGRWNAAQVRRVLIRGASQAIQLCIDGQARGPFTKAQVMSMLDAGTVTRDTLFWHYGMAKGGRPLRELFAGADPGAASNPAS